MACTHEVRLEGLLNTSLYTPSRSPCSPFVLPIFGLVGKSGSRVSRELSVVIFSFFCIVRSAQLRRSVLGTSHGSMGAGVGLPGLNRSSPLTGSDSVHGPLPLRASISSSPKSVLKMTRSNGYEVLSTGQAGHMVSSPMLVTDNRLRLGSRGREWGRGEREGPCLGLEYGAN